MIFLWVEFSSAKSWSGAAFVAMNRNQNSQFKGSCAEKKQLVGENPNPMQNDIEIKKDTTLCKRKTNIMAPLFFT